MSNPCLPSSNLELFDKIIGVSIKKVRRSILIDDLTSGRNEQGADGSIELSFSNGRAITFLPYAEENSIKVISDFMPKYGESYAEKDVTDNEFWSSRVGYKIIEIRILRDNNWSSSDAGEFGIELSFENNNRALFLFTSDEDRIDSLWINDGSKKNSFSYHDYYVLSAGVGISECGKSDKSTKGQ